MFKTIKSFFSRVPSVFANLFAKAPSVAQTVNTTVKLVAPIISAIVAKAAGDESAAVVDSIIKEVETDLAVVAGTIQATGLSGTGKATVQSSLQAVVDNLQALLAAGHIKNAGLLGEITSDVSFAVNEINAVIDVVKTYQPAAPVPVPAPAQ